MPIMQRFPIVVIKSKDTKDVISIKKEKKKYQYGRLNSFVPVLLTAATFSHSALVNRCLRHGCKSIVSEKKLQRYIRHKRVQMTRLCPFCPPPPHFPIQRSLLVIDVYVTVVSQ